MQMPLSFAQEPSSESEPGVNVWTMLDAKQRNEALALLARLLAKTSAANLATSSTEDRRGRHDD
jgi:hypothetical protein